MANVADQFIAALYTGVSATNVIGTSGAPIAPLQYAGSTSHPADAYIQVLEPAKVLMDQANVPEEGRYFVCPPWFVSLISQTQAFLSVTDMQGQPSGTFRRGFVGQASGFNIMKSNNVPIPVAGAGGNGTGAGNAWALQYGHPMGITYGEQITETEALR